MDLKAFFHKQLSSAKDFYIADLQAMTPEMLGSRHQDGQRTAYDFSYEIGVINGRVVSRLTGVEPEPWPGGWIYAPEELQSKEKMVEYLGSSFDALLKAWEALPEDQVWNEIDTAGGKTNPVDLAYFVAYHTGYHDGQLNYIQARHGDADVHCQD